MLVVKCTNCDQGFKCEQSKAGEQVSCPKCHARILVPFDAPDYDAKVTRPAQPTPERPAAPERSDVEKELMVRLAAMEEALFKIAQDSRGIRWNTFVIALIVSVSFVFGLIAAALIFFGALVSIAE
jgi:DNA-directed RNA polymerase subunit RPC12/RpoP